MASDGELYVSDEERTTRLLYTLADGIPDLVTREKGTVVYKEGRIRTWDSNARDYLFCESDRATWIVWGSTFMRIHSLHADYVRGRLRIDIGCSQSVRAGYAEIDWDHAQLSVIEPSPPRPLNDWLLAEQARAVRDVVADGHGPAARPRVGVPAGGLSDGIGYVQIDPWAPEFTGSEEIQRTVDARGGVQPTAAPDAWLIGYRDQYGAVKDDWNGVTYPTFEEAQADLARDRADSALDLRLFEVREVRS